jgi:tetratricopeptide (TPR) repeat protein
MRDFMIRFCITARSILATVMLLASSAFWGQSPPQRAVETPAKAVALAALQGVVRDSSAHPVADAVVHLQAEDGHPLTAHTDSTGTYRFSAIPEGSYTLRAEMAGHVSATSSTFVLGANVSRTIDLTLQPAKGDESQNSAMGPEFYDEPHFTVAGVTDTTNLGGHGSDVIVRNREALASATAALKTETADKTNADEAERHHLLADADEKRGDPLQAVREYQRAAELNPSEPNLFDWGTELLTHHAAEPAVEVFTKGNRLFPRSVRMLAGLGASLYALGSFDQAAQRLCEASDLNPDDPNPYRFMGKMQAVETSPSEAIEERLARFVRLHPQNAWANYYYAVSLQKRQKSPEDAQNLDQVIVLLQNAVHLDPKLGLAYLELGIIYSEQKDFPKAVSALQRAIEAIPSLEEAHYRLAQAYKQMGEIAKAHTELQLYEQISKEKTQEIERQRHELQQFVFELRDRAPVPQQ